MATRMTPVVETITLANGDVLVSTFSDDGLVMVLSDSLAVAKATITLDVSQSKAHADFLTAAEATYQLELLTVLQGHFETEMGAELISYNSQALVKDANRVYTQAVTRLAFDAYQKGLDGVPT